MGIYLNIGHIGFLANVRMLKFESELRYGTRSPNVRTPVDIPSLRKLLKIKWQVKIPNNEVLKRAAMQSIHTVLKLAQLRWTGHVIRMSMENYKRESALKVARRNATILRI